MTLQDALSVFRNKNISITASEGKLAVRAEQGVVTPDIVALLKEHKEQILAVLAADPVALTCDVRITPAMLPLVSLTQEQVDRIVVGVPGGAGNVQDIYPLAPLQEGILFHHLLQSEGDAYLMCEAIAFDSRGRLDTFLAALQRVIDRHDILRSAMHWTALPQPVQVVHRQAALPVEEVVLDADGDPVQQLLERSDPRKVRLDLHGAPLLAAYVAADPHSAQWYMSLLYHHLVCDHVSLEFMLDEVRAFLRGDGDRLPPSLPYRNFIARIDTVPAAEHETWFRSQLGDLDETTAPFGLLAVYGDGGQIREATEWLDDTLALRIRALVRQRGISAAVLFHVAWAQVVARCSGRDDVVFGTVLSGRMQGAAGADRILGLFINTLPIRVRLGGKSVIEAVQETYQNLTRLLAHEQASLALAQRCSAVPAGTPLFSALLNYRHSQAPGNGNGGAHAWEGMRMLSGEERSNYPFTMSVDDYGTGFRLNAQCAERIAPQRVTAYLATAMGALLDALEHDPQQAVAGLNILPPAEKRQLADFNATAAATAPEQCVHRLFEAHAAAQGDAIALWHPHAVLSYDGLNRRANRLAHRLVELGIGPDRRVAICAERGVDMVVGLLAVLKAGGAYVPLDPGYPAERLAYMLADSAPAVLLTHAALQPALPAAGMPVLLFDADDAQHDAEHNPDPDALGLTPDHPAYVIYTSGSTGKPKGVINRHRGLCNLAGAQVGLFDVGPGSRVLQFASFSFDASIWECVMALCSGATLYLVPREALHAGAPLLGTLQRHRITHATLPSSVLAACADQDGLDPMTLIVAGEACPAALARHWSARHRFFNAYGPTETTVCASVYRCDPAQEGAPPIGRPIANMRIHILDAHLQPVPLGVAGEIHIGGAGVARGYLNLPTLTAERFIPDPFSGADGAKLYKTGDLGRWNADGQIEYLGRNDFQIKLRGFRVELGEIEAQLLACDGVRDCRVIAREDAPGDKRLVAYLIADDGASLAAGQLRRQLAVHLAEHMIPGAFIVLDAFPLTPNGKLDRQALAAPDARALATRAYEAPQGEIETAVAQVWQQLLGLERVGRHDHFFELGGHSLMAVGLIERLREQGLESDVRTLFATPTLSAFAAAIAGRDPSKAAPPVPANLIAADCRHITPELLPLVELTQEQIDHIVDGVPHGVANIQDIYPLAPLQEGMLFHHLLQTDGDAYLMREAMAFDSKGRLDAFLGAMQVVVKRHDILRSAMHWTDLPHAVQVVYREAPLPVTELTLSSGEDPAQQLLALTDPRKLRLDLQRAPLLAAFVAADPQGGQWFLALLYHHIVCDHVTLELMLAEVRALLCDASVRLPAPLPYRDFIAQTRAVPDAEHEQYFRRRLGDVDESTAPFGLLDTHGDGVRVAEAKATLDASLAQGIRDAVRQHGISAAVLFHVAWAQVVAQCSGRDDVVFGTVLSGRLQGAEGADRMLGLFINTLPIRIRLAGRSVLEAVQDTYENLRELLDHEQASLALAQRCTALPPALPLFSALFNYRHTHVDTIESAWEGMRVLSGEERTNYPVTMSVDDLGHGFALTAQCVTGIDPQRVVAYLGVAIANLIDALARDPQGAIHPMSILPASERQLVLHDANRPALGAPAASGRLIHQLFEAQAAARPDAIALRHEHQQLSYGQLNARANRLAHRLIALGIGPDQRVAICAERGIDMVVGLLAVLKAGGAYVPLDPSYPAERLAYMLDDSAPVALLTQGAIQAQLPAHTVPVLLLDDPAHATGPDHDPDPAALGLTVHHLAYIIYTSGSTGKPKGAMVEHGNVVRLFSATEPWFRFGATDVWTLFHSFAFDFSVWEIWGALLHGGRLVVVPYLTTRSPDDFYRLLADEGVTVLNQTPSAFRQLIAAQAGSSRSHCLRNVIFGGEALDVAALKPWYRDPRNEQTRLVNMYGITETTVHVTYHPLTPSDCEAVGPSPIGRPIPDLQIYVLDPYGNPVPVGVAGEMYVAGAGVARGYLNRPQLSAERFIKNPFSTDADARMYRTGDLGQRRSDGSIVYLGRIDSQVKIRGFRIELGEIEAQLAACEGVRDATVIVRADAPGEQRLVAYFVPTAKPVSTDRLRMQLAAALPDYMVPTAFIALDNLPLTGNGKLDRQALPAPGSDAYALRPYQAPADELEEALARIWADALKHDRISVNDNYFHLGGDSIRSIAIVAEARKRGIALTIADMFKHPTIAGLAGVLRLRGAPEPASQPPETTVLGAADRAALPAGVEDAYPMMMLQLGMVFHNQLGEHDGIYHDVMTQRLTLPSWDAEALRDVLHGMSRKHPMLRTAFDLHRFSEPLQLVYADAEIPLTVFDLRGVDADAQARAVARFVADERTTRFELEQAPLLRIFVHLLGAHDVQVTLSCHHAILDGWSVAALQTELFNRLYAALSTPGARQEFTPLAQTPRRAVEAERAALQCPRHRTFWRDYLDDYVFCTLPPKGEDEAAAGPDCRRNIQVPEHTCARLEQLADTLGVPLRTVLLSAHLRVVALLSGGQDVTTGLVSNVRPEETDGASVLGLYLNTLPFRQHMAEGSWADLIRATYDNELAVTEYRRYPYGQLHIDNGGESFYEIAFNYVNFHVYDGLSAPGALVKSDINNFEATDHALMTNFAYNRTVGLQVVLVGADLSPAQIARIHGYYLAVLDAIAADPQAPHQNGHFLSPEEYRRVVAGVDATTVTAPSEGLIHRLFEARVRVRPDAVAVTFGTEAVTYRQLNRRANGLAHHLIGLGVGPDVPVAICAERGIDMVVGLLAVLKAGGAYVPLDPSYPSERLAYMLDDSAPVALLTQRAIQAQLPELTVPVVLLDDPVHATGPDHDPDPAALGLTTRHLAYIIYTSGSTGKPKGVMVEHGNVARLFSATEPWFRFGAADVWTLFHSFAFDFSVWEIWGALLHGGRLVVVPYLTTRSPDDFYRLLADEGVTVLNQTPSAFRQLIAAQAGSSQSHRLRNVIFGGEALDVAALKPWYRDPRNEQTRLVNMYGITETTVHVTYQPLTASDCEAVGPSPIGHPIPDLHVYVLDPHGNPVPVGVAGEMYVAGAGVARGYLNRPQLSAERFCRNPFSADPDARMYRTGDLGRRRSDGSIVYLGRNDFQVKIRGFRIELGEIEAQLGACDGVAEAIVVAGKDAAGAAKLVAYLRAHDGATLEVARLRRQLATVLADHMVPGAFVVLDAFPLTANGKLDRKALPAPTYAPASEHAFEAPRGDIETALAAAWQQLLGIERVGRHDHFFDLGGHSLLSVQLVARMREQLGIEIPVRATFELPVLADLADFAASLKLDLFTEEEIANDMASLDGLSESELLAMLSNHTTNEYEQ